MIDQKAIIVKCLRMISLDVNTKSEENDDKLLRPLMAIYGDTSVICCK